MVHRSVREMLLGGSTEDERESMVAEDRGGGRRMRTRTNGGFRGLVSRRSMLSFVFGSPTMKPRPPSESALRFRPILPDAVAGRKQRCYLEGVGGKQG